MTHYIQYWKPERAALAFNGRTDPIEHLENGYFKWLAPNDVLWIVTYLSGTTFLLVARGVVERVSERTEHPIYAVGNSKEFRNFRATFESSTAASAGAIEMPLALIRRLRFATQASRVRGSLYDVLTGPLASLRKLTPASENILENLWDRSPRPPWAVTAPVTRLISTIQDAETRSAVERGAIDAVSKGLRRAGWHVESKEAAKVGYDLLCTKRGATIHVEVKGTSGDSQLFFLTRGELERARTDPAFVLAIVTRALDRPAIALYSGNEMETYFALQPLAFAAAPMNIPKHPSRVMPRLPRKQR